MSDSRNADSSSEILRNAAAIRTELTRNKELFSSYLDLSEARPPVDGSLLKMLLASTRMLDAVSPRRHAFAGFADQVGLPDDVFGETTGEALEVRNVEDTDFFPWLYEKTSRVNAAVVRLIDRFSEDPRGVWLQPDAPLSAKEWVRDGIQSAVSEIEHNIVKVFDSLFSDEIHVVEAGSVPRTNKKRESWAIPSLLPLDSHDLETVKVGLGQTSWSNDPDVWRRGAFEGTLDRMDSSVKGESSPLRVLNVQVWKGADVIIREGHTTALLWQKWEPVFWDVDDRLLWDRAEHEIEAGMAAWSSSRPAMRAVRDLGHLMLAVAIQKELATGNLDELMGHLSDAAQELSQIEAVERPVYEQELERWISRFA